jgi:diphosphomevalonate decarboxylase
VLTAVRAQLEPAGRTGADVSSDNDFPTGAGLASSAAGFAALAVGATAAAGLDLPACELSALARLGSGSAARSIHGGFAELLVGARPDGADAVAEPLLAPEAWPLSIAIAATADEAKSVVSADGMQASAATSPFYGPWLHGAPADLVRARAAIARRDLADLGDLAEANALRMHAVMLATRPALLYWNGATVEVLHAVRALRRQGVGAWATIDAGPQVKVLSAPADGLQVAAALAAVPGVLRVITCGLGPGARVVPFPGEDAR